MAPNDEKPLRITLEDLAGVPEASGSNPIRPAQTGVPKAYGSIASDPSAPEPVAEKSSVFLQGWFYLGLAGLLGALAAWAICEPAFVDGSRAGERWGNTWIIPGLITLMCVGFGVSESLVERSVKKALLRGALAIPLGIVLGFVFDFVANIIYSIGIQVSLNMGVQSNRNPALWIARGIAWAVFGAAGGAIYGIVGRSLKKAQYGILGGMLGAAVGGMIFDPIALAAGGAGLSRAIGFALVGAATGAAMGLVESMLKDRWLYVTAGPLAGKQFILYKNKTTIGAEQTADIYLFKDPNILPHHAAVEIQGSRVQVRALGAAFVGGGPVHIRVLQDGDLLQIGRYAFRYREKRRE